MNKFLAEFFYVLLVMISGIFFIAVVVNFPVTLLLIVPAFVIALVKQ